MRQEADSTGEGVVDTLVARKVISAAHVAQAKAAQFGVEFVNLGEMRLRFIRKGNAWYFAGI